MYRGRACLRVRVGAWRERSVRGMCASYSREVEPASVAEWRLEHSASFCPRQISALEVRQHHVGVKQIVVLIIVDLSL